MDDQIINISKLLEFETLIENRINRTNDGF